MDKIIVEDRKYHTALRMGCAVYESILISFNCHLESYEKELIERFPRSA